MHTEFRYPRPKIGNLWTCIWNFPLTIWAIWWSKFLSSLSVDDFPFWVHNFRQWVEGICLPVRDELISWPKKIFQMRKACLDWYLCWISIYQEMLHDKSFFLRSDWNFIIYTVRRWNHFQIKLKMKLVWYSKRFWSFLKYPPFYSKTRTELNSNFQNSLELEFIKMY